MRNMEDVLSNEAIDRVATEVFSPYRCEQVSGDRFGITLEFRVFDAEGQLIAKLSGANRGDLRSEDEVRRLLSQMRAGLEMKGKLPKRR